MNYSRCYFILMFKAKDRISPLDAEKHHSVPKHWFIENKTKKDYDHTIILLSKREHFLAHRLLCKMYPNSEKAKLALLRMMNTEAKRDKYHVNSRLYESAKEKFVTLIKTIRTDPVLDGKRRKAASAYMKKIWLEDRDDLMVRIKKMRESPKDQSRRKASSDSLKKKHENGLTEQTKKRNKKLAHMSVEQKSKFLEQAAEYRKSESFVQNMEALKKINRTFVAVIDNEGNNHFISREIYKDKKGIDFHHVNSRQAKAIRQKKCN